ncbi:preprotein translocase, SecE subunit [Vibrio atlanticus]|uniref:Preprotein translocase, SecE subunit n=1 Tax=Vibrio atlanticus (strain LGP32) TaxID=575788 RepID=B7VM76_VIBA3|nr:preprotein translocase, SecE subunit [Vibrio atlanticus]
MKANAETPDSSGAADTMKWVVAFVLLAAAVVGNYLYGELSVVIRAAGVVVLIAAALGVAATTTKGKAAIDFAKESRMEIRKSCLAFSPSNYANYIDRFSCMYCYVSSALGN